MGNFGVYGDGQIYYVYTKVLWDVLKAVCDANEKIEIRSKDIEDSSVLVDMVKKIHAGEEFETSGRWPYVDLYVVYLVCNAASLEVLKTVAMREESDSSEFIIISKALKTKMGEELSNG